MIKWTPETVQKLKDLIIAGTDYDKIAGIFGTSKNTIAHRASMHNLTQYRPKPLKKKYWR